MKRVAVPREDSPSKRLKTESEHQGPFQQSLFGEPDNTPETVGNAQASALLANEADYEALDLDTLCNSGEDIIWGDSLLWPVNYEEDSLGKPIGSGEGLLDKAPVLNGNSLVCYGTLTGIPIVQNKRILDYRRSRSIPATFGINSTICELENGKEVGRLVRPADTALRALWDDADVELELLAQIRVKRETTSKMNRAAKANKIDVTISATIYGPLSRLDDVGNYLQDCDLYLQDPLHCLHNVEYRNPHRITSLDATAPMTKDLVTSGSSLEQLLEKKSDMLNDVECRVALPEASQPQGLEIALHSHQLQALTFLVQRESGLANSATNLGIWRNEPSINGGLTYINSVTGEPQADRPRIFRGGILADEMGLGKTLAMISLIAHDKSLSVKSLRRIGWTNGYNSVNATLIIVPPSLLTVWDRQLSQHVQRGALRWTWHYDKNRVKRRANFKNVDIVLTTYSTIVSEWKQNRHEEFPILSSRWRRVILDEAHEIRNRKTARHKAVCSIDAHSRWAITGTPIQNSISDFASLLKYLRADPYDNPSTFNEHILDLCKAHAADEALERLKRLMMALLLRRSRHTTIKVPKRVNLVRRLDFTITEEARYQSLESSTIECLDIAIAAGQSVKKAYANAVRKILSLRMLCDLGTYPIKAKSDPSLLVPSGDISLCASPLRLKSPALCEDCAVDIGDLGGAALSPNERCDACTTLAQAAELNLDSPLDSTYDIEDDRSIFETTVPDMELATFMPVTLPHSTKISTLVSDIQDLPSETKVVVFSCWTSILDFIADALEAASISAVQYDGRLRNKDRAIVLSRFQTDPELRVILVSMACGAVGLDMTAASHVFLMEPQWNPAVEEQALSRVYRMGQTKEVTTVRYIMNATFEEHVMKVQDKKKGLADLLLSNGQGTDKSGPRNQLKNWRSLFE